MEVLSPMSKPSVLAASEPLSPSLLSIVMESRTRSEEPSMEKTWTGEFTIVRSEMEPVMISWA